MHLNIAVLFISKCPLHWFILENLFLYSKLFGLKCLCAIFWDCNEDISVNILKFAYITHYVELIYTYHTTTYLYLHSLGVELYYFLYTLESTYTPLLYTLGGSFRPVCGTPHECMLFTPFLTVHNSLSSCSVNRIWVNKFLSVIG